MAMDLRFNPFPSKTQPLKPKKAEGTRKSIADESKTRAKEPTISRQKRVFGTARNTNNPIKNVANNPLNKPSIRVPQKLPKPLKPTPSATNVATNPATIETSKITLPEKEKPKLEKEGFRFQKRKDIHQEENVTCVVSPRTPVASPSLNKSAKTVGTPYHTPEKCSTCRFDRLETASYWLAQIEVAESVGKHFVSAAFFGLAFESKAEPIRNLRTELERYLARHGYLSTQNEWKAVSLIYKLPKGEDNAERKISGIDEDGTSNNHNIACCDLDEE